MLYLISRFELPSYLAVCGLWIRPLMPLLFFETGPEGPEFTAFILDTDTGPKGPESELRCQSGMHARPSGHGSGDSDPQWHVAPCFESAAQKKKRVSARRGEGHYEVAQATPSPPLFSERH